MHTRNCFTPPRMAAVLVLALFAAFTLPGFGQNLVYNGDFELGNTGFYSNYINNQVTIWDEGRYAITPIPHNQHPHFVGFDHTSGSGLLMAVNGATYGTQQVWGQAIAVQPNTHYRLSVWVCSLVSESPATLGISVDGILQGDPYAAPSDTGLWTEFAVNWCSGNNTSVTIRIVDQSLAYSGNDFGLDDISVTNVDTPPVITGNTFELWAPNHKYVTFPLSQLASVTDDCDAAPTLDIVSVTSDEPEDAIGNGDGNTLDDIVFVDCETIKLRAERAGGLNGRVYTINLVSTDAYGHTIYGAAYVTVPHDYPNPAVADAPVYTEQCNAPPKRPADDPASFGFALEQNYPNPFNPMTTIAFTLPADGDALLRVLDAAGNEVAVLAAGYHAAGAYNVAFDASALSSGMYLYRLECGDVVLQRTMQLVK
jgi:hypothetical protein